MFRAFYDSLNEPSEIYSLIRWMLEEKDVLKIIKEPLINSAGCCESGSSESNSGRYDPAYTKAMCYYFLNLTSRSFSRVIQELDEELRHPVCLFYLVLRALDTIEDDMTLTFKKKATLLNSFHEHIFIPGWNFTESGDNEKDRDLLARFDVVIEEFLRLDSRYKKVIADITRRMASGMVEFRKPGKRVENIDDLNLYCHYAAGLVGIGLTNLFVASGLESRSLQLHSQLPSEDMPDVIDDTGNKLDLANRMGLFLQKVNIIKDFLQDLVDGRVFWPESVWTLYTPESSKMDISTFTSPENVDRALGCLNHLCANALDLVPDCLDYMSRIQSRSVFQFCAIPQKKGVKIRRGLTIKLIFASKDLESVKSTYQAFMLDLHQKNRLAVQSRNPHNKSFYEVDVALGKIQAWLNTHTMIDSSSSSLCTNRSILGDMDNTIFILGFILVLLMGLISYYNPLIFEYILSETMPLMK